LCDTISAAVARGVPAAKLASVEKKMWKMVSDVAALEPPAAERKALTLPPLKSSSSEPSLRGKAVGWSVAAPGAVAAASSDPGALVKSWLSGAKSSQIMSSHVKSDPGAQSITGSAEVVRGAGKWRQRHKRVHLDEPISVAEVSAPPTKSRAATAALEQEARDAKDKKARQVAYLLGSLRERAQTTGGEIDRNSFYAALVEHGMLEDVSNTAFTEAPVFTEPRLTVPWSSCIPHAYIYRMHSGSRPTPVTANTLAIARAAHS